jgi:hypothetical protein
MGTDLRKVTDQPVKNPKTMGADSGSHFPNVVGVLQLFKVLDWNLIHILNKSEGPSNFFRMFRIQGI